MEINTVDASMVSKMFLAGAKNLDDKKEWINELNVFPVPDGDTGTNMSMTIMSAAKEVAAMESPDMANIAKVISSGTLRGARGNSGVILSQLFRGFTKVITHYDTLDVTILSEAATKAVETAYKAVMKPKEGTILTVARGAADKAAELALETDNIVYFMEEVLKEAKLVLAKTPDMLPVLKQAGVVDSGGQGLVEVLNGAYRALIGKEADFEIESSDVNVRIVKTTAETEAEIKFGYCTEFIIVLNHPATLKTENELKEYLESMGDSIVVVADDEIIKIHVHTNDPGLVLQKALTLGSLSRIKIDNMREEHQEKLIKESEKLAKEQAAEREKERMEHSENSESKNSGSQPGSERQLSVLETSAGETDESAVKLQAAQETASENNDETAISGERKKYGFISVSVGDGINEILRGLGVDYIIEGGQTMNPSTEDILQAIEKVNAQTIFILPNNSNIILAANQAVNLCDDKEIIVIPTKNIPQGIVALINCIPEQSAKENADRMKEEIQLVKTGMVTYAVRDTTIDGKEIKENDYMGIGDSTILSVGQDMEQTTLDMVAELVDEDVALLSIYYGEDIDKASAEAFAAKLEELYPECEIEVNYGGQPIYYYLISVE